MLLLVLLYGRVGVVENKSSVDLKVEAVATSRVEDQNTEVNRPKVHGPHRQQPQPDFEMNALPSSVGLSASYYEFKTYMYR